MRLDNSVKLPSLESDTDSSFEASPIISSSDESSIVKILSSIVLSVAQTKEIEIKQMNRIEEINTIFLYICPSV